MIADSVLDGKSAYSYAGGISNAGPLEVFGTSLTGNSASAAASGTRRG